jgi:hypothetical protein
VSIDIYLSHIQNLMMVSAVTLDVVRQVATLSFINIAATAATISPLRLHASVLLLRWHISNIAQRKNTHPSPSSIQIYHNSSVKMLELLHRVNHVVEIATVRSKRDWQHVGTTHSIFGIECGRNLVKSYQGMSVHIHN